MPEQGYKIVQVGPSSYSVEGFVRDGNTQRLRSVSGLRSEADARQWVYDHKLRTPAEKERGSG